MGVLLKIVPNKFDNENRDKREISVVRELGHEIVVIAKGEINEVKIIDDFEVHCRTTRPLGNNKLIVNINRLTSLLTWALYARKIKPDVISGHDMTGIFIGWLSTLFMPKIERPLLVYDSHEFELGRNTARKRSKLTKWRISIMEKFLIGKSTFSMMVNDSISNEVQTIYNLKDKPIVVRNIPAYCDIDEEICKKRREQICNTLNIPYNTLLVMYHGGITKGRGIENLIQSVKRLDNVVAIILGYGQEEYIKELNELISSSRIEGKVFFFDAVHTEILWQYVGAVDIGMIVVPNTSKSYYYGLPNKLFENIQSLTPIIGSNFPEIKRIIEGYDVGICCDPHDINDIANSIKKLKEDKALYNKFKENLKRAKEELCWENEKMILIDAYSRAFDLIEKRNKSNF